MFIRKINKISVVFEIYGYYEKVIFYLGLFDIIKQFDLES